MLTPWPNDAFSQHVRSKQAIGKREGKHGDWDVISGGFANRVLPVDQNRVIACRTSAERSLINGNDSTTGTQFGWVSFLHIFGGFP